MKSDQSHNNPFAAPMADIAYEPLDPDVSREVAIRREYLKRESSIRSVGTLFVVFSVVLGGLTIVIPSTLILSFQGGANAGLGMTVALTTLVVLGFLVAGQLAVGLGLRRLKSWSRIPAIVISVLWMFHFPVGTILNIVFLVSLLGTKNSFVFTPEYGRIINATPQMKHRSSSSTLFWAVTIIFVAILLTIGLSVWLIENDLNR